MRRTFRRILLCAAAITLAAPWLFLGIIEIGTTSLWDSPAAARTAATQISRVLLYASMIVLPVAASVYGALTPRRRILMGVLGGVLGMALWLASLVCLGYLATP